MNLRDSRTPINVMVIKKGERRGRNGGKRKNVTGAGVGGLSDGDG